MNKSGKNIIFKPFYICFIDLKAAYDWINRDMLFKILEIRINPIRPGGVSSRHAATKKVS